MGFFGQNIPASYPLSSEVSLLLHFDGANNSTTFTDSSTNNFSVTRNGDAKISTTEYKFGGASGFFDGNGDYLTVGASGTTQLQMGTSHFTMEGWFRFSTVPSGVNYAYFLTLGGNNANGIGYFVRGGKIEIWHNGSSRLVCNTTLIADTWYHIAFVRSFGRIRVYLDGTEDGNVAFTSNLSNGAVAIGNWAGVDNTYFHGYIDELRIVKGRCLYPFAFTSTSDTFSAPSSEFPNP